MPSPVVVEFLLKGMPEVQRAMRTVADAMAASENAATKSSQRGSRARVSEAEAEARMKIRSMLKADVAQKQAQDKASSDRQRLLQRRSQLEQRATANTLREVERETRGKIRMHDQAERDIDRIRQRGERKAQQTIQRETADRKRAHSAEAAASWKDYGEKARARQRMGSAIGNTLISGVSAGVSRVGGLAAKTAGVIGQLGGGFSIADSIQQAAGLQRAAAQLSNSAFIRGKIDPATGKPMLRPDANAIVSQARGVSAAIGVDATELVEGVKGYVAKSSDLAGGMKNMDFFGRVSKATGASMSDVTKTAGMLRVQNKNLDDAGMKQLLLSTIGQGQVGSVEFEDLARVAGKVTRSSVAYQGGQAENQAKLLGLSQIAMRTSGSPDESATVLANLSSDALKHRDKVGAAIGADFMNDKGQITSPEDLLARVFDKTGGNLGKIADLGFGARSMKMFQALAPDYNEAEAQKKGSGKQAILDEIKSVSASGYDEKALNDDVQNILSTPAEQFEKVIRDLKTELGSKLLPEFIKLLPTVRELAPSFITLMQQGVPAIVELLKTFADFASSNKELINDIAAHPVGAIIAASVAKSILDAAIGATVKSAISGVIGSSGGLVIGTAAIAIAAGVIAIDKMFKDEDKGRETAQGQQRRAVELTARIRQGTATPEERTEAAELAHKLKDTKEKQVKEQVDPGIVREVLGFAGGKTAKKDEKEQQDRAIGDTTKAFDALIAALIANTTATNAAAKGGAPGAPAPGGAKPVAATTGVVQRTK